MFYLISSNPILKKVLLFILAVCACSCAKVLADRASELWGPKAKYTEASLQAVMDMKKKLPIPIDDVTSIIDIDFDEKEKKLIYSIKIKNINKNEIETLYDTHLLKENLQENLCDSNKQNFQNGYKKIKFIYIGNDDIEMFRIFLIPEVCQKYDRQTYN